MRKSSVEDDRREIVKRYWDSEQKTSWPNKEKLTTNQVRREFALQEKLLERYTELLTAVPVSRCPFCGVVLNYSFDAMGLEGMWWCKDAIVEASPPEESHFRVLLGSIDFHGREPEEAEPNGSVIPGPGAPFVVPRLLGMEGMIAVMSCLTLPNDDTAYLISYFSEEEMNEYELHQPWARESYDVHDVDGEFESWGTVADSWDFELQPWIDKGRLKWIDPGDKSLTIKDSGKCPYVGLPGTRQPQVIESGKLGLLPLPDDEPINPFD